MNGNLKAILVRYHYMPRNSKFTPEADDCPIPLDHLSKHRESYDGNHRRFDKWKNKESSETSVWTGYTRFKIDVNSLLGSVFVSLLWFQDSSPMMFRFNAHR